MTTVGVHDPAPALTGSRPAPCRGRAREAARVLSWVATVAVALGAAWACWPVVRGEPPRLAVVAGHSMRPTLAPGDVVVLQPRRAYRRGDVVAFRVPRGQPGAGTLVVHRILQARGGPLTTQGDHNERPDPWRMRDVDVVGRLVLRVPWLGRSLVLLRSPGLLLALAAGLLATGLALRPRGPAAT